MCAWIFAGGGGLVVCALFEEMRKLERGKAPLPWPNDMGREHFTITEKQAKQRQDGSWYMETVKVEKSSIA